MTKQELIEKMAVDIAKSDCSLWEHCPKDPKHNCTSQNPEIMLESSKNYVTIATWLVNANYRKLPEDAVVLTKEELVKTMESGYVYDTTRENKTNIIEMEREIERKETAKEFAEKLRNKYGKSCSEYYPELIELTSIELDELLKEYEVEE